MTLDEVIKNMETIAEGNQLAIDTGIIFNDTPIDMFFCDNNEVKNKCLANYQRCAEEHRQLAEWLKDYKRLLDRELCEDCISRQAVLDKAFEIKTGKYTSAMVVYAHDIRTLSPVTPQSNTGHWIEEPNCWVRCSCCGEHYPHTSIYGFIGSNYCPNCGAKMDH